MVLKPQFLLPGYVRGLYFNNLFAKIVGLFF